MIAIKYDRWSDFTVLETAAVEDTYSNTFVQGICFSSDGG